MDIKQFLVEFKHIASAPNGAEQIRQIVMGLALSGKLTTDNRSLPKDFALRLEEAKQKYYNTVEKKPKPIVFGTPLLTEPPIPTGWRWVRVAEVCDLQTGATPSKRHPEYFGGDIKWLVSGDIHQNEIFDCEGRITEAGLQNSNAKILPPDSVLMALNGQGKTRASVAILRVPAACNQSLVAIIPFDQGLLSPEYLFLSLKYRYHEIRNITGQKQRRGLNMGLVSRLSIPLAPIEEQKRIVAKVDELMVLSDKLQSQQQECKELNKLICDTVFEELSNATTSSEITIAWHRIEKNAPLLLSDLAGIQAFKKAILGLAMSGSLLIDTVSSSGSEVLAQISKRRTEWQQSVTGQELTEAIRIQKKLQKQHQKIPAHNLPEHWSWGSLLQVSQALVDCHNKTAPYIFDGIHLVRTSDIRNGQMNLENTAKISEQTYDYWSRRLPPKPGDVFFTREAPMGEAAIVPDGEKVCLGQRTMLIRLFPELFSNKFLLYAIYSPAFQERMKTAAVGMTVKHLRVGDAENLMVPVPPKLEQDQIVAIIDSLFDVCNKLENGLMQRNRTASNLAKSTVELITGIHSERQEKMKPPNTTTRL